MTQNNNLKKYCRVATNKDDDTLVGVKGDATGIEFIFPLGYHLSEEDSDLRRDVLHLLSILKEFKDDENKGEVTKREDFQSKEVEFPFNAYVEIIHYFLENGYYKETEPIYQAQSRGKIHWSKTIKSQRPFLIKNNQSKYRPIYTQFTVRKSAPDEDNEITKINQFCVYESFTRIGVLFSSFMPPKPIGKYDGSVKNRYLTLVQDKLINTNNDNKKRLFKAMIEVISSYDADSNKRFHYGTENFHNVFEKLIDMMFCNVRDKNKYYPRTKWNLQEDGPYDIPHPLQPDTIMVYGNNIYVIDAKYYKYGDTHLPKDLPKNADVNKQISYGDYINSKYDFDSIYNAFLMPYNKKGETFDNFNKDFENVGEAIAPWRKNDKEYEHIQGILIDLRYLMDNYRSKSEEHTMKLATAIEEAFEKNKQLYEN